jgi:hypothetical protein
VIEWPVVAGLVMLAGFLITVIVTVVKFTDRLTKAEGAVELSREAKAQADKAAADLAEFKEKVARDYVTGTAIERLEERLVDAINRLGDRLDRAFDGRPATRTTRPKA